MTRKERRFAQLLREHGPGLGRIAASYARPADQDDLRQEIAIAIWNALDGFRGDCSERTYLYRIAHNRGLSHVARRRVAAAELPPVADGAPGPEARGARRWTDCSRRCARCRSRSARCSRWRWTE
jgi:RNA polymerase sigma factor (sigma-70 family)